MCDCVTVTVFMLVVCVCECACVCVSVSVSVCVCECECVCVCVCMCMCMFVYVCVLCARVSAVSCIASLLYNSGCVLFACPRMQRVYTISSASHHMYSTYGISRVRCKYSLQPMFSCIDALDYRHKNLCMVYIYGWTSNFLKLQVPCALP